MTHGVVSAGSPGMLADELAVYAGIGRAPTRPKQGGGLGIGVRMGRLDGPAVCWVVSDGRRGIENQALGLAEAVARRVALRLHTVHAPRPTLVRSPLPVTEGAAPDLWIGCGRAAVDTARAHKRRYPQAKFVYVQDPRRAHTMFDLIVAPRHDGLTGPNVLNIVGAPNRITEETLAEGRAPFTARIYALPKPRLAVLIGGDSKRHKLTDAMVAALIAQLSELAEGASLMISVSRRTPEGAVKRLRAAFEGHGRVWLWTSDEDGPNPYFAFLAAADVAVVTKDSTNMLTDAASAGLPILIAPMAGRDGKFATLYQDLEDRRIARPFTGTLEIWPVAPLAETDRAAEAVAALLEPALDTAQ